jgi:hypothetical protein
MDLMLLVVDGMSIAEHTSLGRSGTAVGYTSPAPLSSAASQLAGAESMIDSANESVNVAVQSARVMTDGDGSEHQFFMTIAFVLVADKAGHAGQFSSSLLVEHLAGVLLELAGVGCNPLAVISDLHAANVGALLELAESFVLPDGRPMVWLPDHTHGCKTTRNGAVSGMSVLLDGELVVFYLLDVLRALEFMSRDSVMEVARVSERHVLPSPYEKMSIMYVEELCAPQVMAALQAYAEVAKERDATRGPECATRASTTRSTSRNSPP